MTEASFQLSPDGALLLQTSASELLGRELSAEQLAQFAALHERLSRASQSVNLTAIHEEREAIIKHYVDSLSLLKAESHLPEGARVFDLGTGAGFPALPLAIARPDLQILAVDGTSKKIEFVGATAAELGLSLTARAARAEDLGQSPQFRATQDAVVTRAVAALPVLVELSLPLLREGGVLLAQKGPFLAEELDAGKKALELVGGAIIDQIDFKLPHLGDARSIVVIQKTAPTPEKYPRRAGMPAKRPLGK